MRDKKSQCCDSASVLSLVSDSNWTRSADPYLTCEKKRYKCRKKSKKKKP
eukprot:CAMPEP_0194508188 /NCGR_PEP_ID=MMETSP0253-20130528/38149_1 /TAXON_ID=2966 /ORGANISM="Noctiluca scintillans" /LENGTH=49 /DNA_ID=CAMNT_0039351183 /DNA_START=58 /DNA_END=207 /DNA_ORIENTATION=-